MKNKSIIIFLLVAGSLAAQNHRKGSAFSIRGSIGIPRSISSQMFRTAFNGVYEGSVSGNARVFDNFFVGLGAQNTHFQNNKQVFAYKTFITNGKATGNVLSYNTRLNCIGGFMKLGYDQYFEKTFLTYALNAGYLNCSYLNVNPDSAVANQPFVPLKFNAPYIQPEISVNFLADGRLTFSMLFSYGIMLTHFDPKAPRFNAVEEVRDKHNKMPISWINLGFGFNVRLGKL